MTTKFIVTRHFTINAASQESAETYVDIEMRHLISRAKWNLVSVSTQQPTIDPTSVGGYDIYADYENLKLSSGEGWFVWEADYPEDGSLGPFETKVDAMIATRSNDIVLVPKKKGQ